MVASSHNRYGAPITPVTMPTGAVRPGSANCPATSAPRVSTAPTTADAASAEFPLSIGDDHARALGVGVDGARVVLLLLAVALVATATSVAGPIAFIALLAPAIARRLVDDGSSALAASAVVGAVLTLGADVVGQFALPGLTAPVGIVTGVIGAPYLLWLLATTERKSRA